METKLTYDPEAGASYVYAPGRKSEYGIVSYTKEEEILDQEGKVITTLYIDYDKNKEVFGVEILSPGLVTLGQILKFFSPDLAEKEKNG